MKERRKYQLHNHVKVFAKVQPKQKVINISSCILDGLSQKQRILLDELSKVYQYSVQLNIP